MKTADNMVYELCLRSGELAPARSPVVTYNFIFPDANPTLISVLSWCRIWGAGVIIDLWIAQIELREN